jgi:hypothetical protein
MICIPKNIAHIEAGTYDLADHPLLGHSRKLAAEMAKCEFERAQKGLVNSGELRPWFRVHLEILGICAGHEREVEMAIMEAAAAALQVEPSELSGRLLGGRPRLIPQDENVPVPKKDILGTRQDREWLYKRQLHNAFMHGLALDYMTRALPLARTALDKVHPNLFDLCIAYAERSQIAMADMPPSPDRGVCKAAGISGAYWVNGRAGYYARATVPNYLMQETVKGALELAFCHGLPKDPTPEVAAAIRRADHLNEEIWNFTFGPELARRVAPSLFRNSKPLEACRRISKLSYAELEAEFIACGAASCQTNL